MIITTNAYKFAYVHLTRLYYKLIMTVDQPYDIKIIRHVSTHVTPAYGVYVTLRKIKIQIDKR